MQPVTYQLWIEVRRDALVTVGKLGRFRFPAGRYVYTGSAVRGLDARVRRHLARTKPLRWHVDYLLAHRAARVVRVSTSELAECELNRRTEGDVPVRGFGASDCRAGCGTHLKALRAKGRKPS